MHVLHANLDGAAPPPEDLRTAIELVLYAAPFPTSCATPAGGVLGIWVERMRMSGSPLEPEIAKVVLHGS